MCWKCRFWHCWGRVFTNNSSGWSCLMSAFSVEIVQNEGSRFSDKQKLLFRFVFTEHLGSLLPKHQPKMQFDIRGGKYGEKSLGVNKVEVWLHSHHWAWTLLIRQYWITGNVHAGKWQIHLAFSKLEAVISIKEGSMPIINLQSDLILE